MTDSEPREQLEPAARSARAAGKRERLVGAAGRLFYEQGIERTTLADIAAAAEVPLGNVYYYFKTKDDLVGAVVEAHYAQIRETVTSLDRHRSPAARLKALLGLLAAQADVIARFGCPQGTLCSELAKGASGGPSDAAHLLEASIEWTESQFRQMGRKDAHDLAIHLIAVYQGTTVLTHVLGQPQLMKAEARRLERWIDSLDAIDSLEGA